jgi:hypothetical protein
MDTVTIKGDNIKIERKLSPAEDVREKFWDRARSVPAESKQSSNKYILLAIKMLSKGELRYAAAYCADAHCMREKENRIKW